ncbi:MAG: DUF3604 domain-containing protein [Candidatus Micropelagos thuwalensis]
MSILKLGRRSLFFLFVAFMSANLIACGDQQDAQNQVDEEVSPPSDQITLSNTIPDGVYWGDLHVHSRLSMDSFSFGNRMMTADDAFKFAKGEPIEAHTGDIAQLKKPLDFLLVSDHAEFLGVIASIMDRKHGIEKTELGKRWSGWLEENNLQSIIQEWVSAFDADTTSSVSKPKIEYPDEAFFKGVWGEMVETAERHNDPGKFSAFSGYEWTSMIDGDNMHRVVIFRDGAEKTLGAIPVSSTENNDPEYLWERLEDYEEKTGGEVLAIPHNSNLSEGRMYSRERVSGAAFDTQYANTRIRWEPVLEMTQVKGDSETHPLVSPNDLFADFERWDETDINSNVIAEDKKVEAYTGSYARPALKTGLALEVKLGVNPFKFGMIGSTDSHTVMATADSDNYYGKFVDSEPSPERLMSKMGGILWNNRMLTAAGYAAVWAEENSREAIFDAIKRKEVYATTGPRIVLRFFGGWDFDETDLEQPDFATLGYKKGVPMGGDLMGADAKGAAPRFMITASKDPDGANLDRVQVVKGWLDADGALKEQIFDVAWSDARVVDPETGVLQPVGSTVNVSEATYTNTIGTENLATVWTDPMFDKSLRAFYYVRVLEIPTPRWTTYDAQRFNLNLPDDVPVAIQERVYSSPIWYTPIAE